VAELIDSGIESLYRIDKFMGSMTDMEKLLQVIITEACSATDAESCSLALYDAETDDLYFYVALGEGGEGEVEKKLKCIRLKMGSGIIGYAASHMETLNIPDAYKDSRFNQDADKKTGFITRSLLAVPMVRRGTLIGVVEAVNKKGEGNYFMEHDEKVLTVLAAQAALVIENARLYEENLKQARLSALGQGIAGAAHCIKNILNGIDGGKFILEVGLKKTSFDKVERGWGIMSKNVVFMKDLVLDMLAYSKPKQLNLQTADINEICGEISNLMSEKARESNTEIKLDLQPDIGPVVIDAKAIFRCILNLVSNSVDAMNKPDGLVTMSTCFDPDNNLKIAVADNGCGISEEALRNIFQIFFSTKGSKGTGIGLAFTEKVIQDHGGDIDVESEIGVGTTFTITLPVQTGNSLLAAGA